MHTHNSESQQQVVGVAAAVASIFISNLCVIVLLVYFFLLLLVCVGLVGCRLVCHPACEDSGRNYCWENTCFNILQHVLACTVSNSALMMDPWLFK